MCHARSGCWSRFNCARYSISKEYWTRAGSHTTGPFKDSEEAFHNCMENENCILNTLKGYTELFGERVSFFFKDLKYKNDYFETF